MRYYIALVTKHDFTRLGVLKKPYASFPKAEAARRSMRPPMKNAFWMVVRGASPGAAGHRAPIKVSYMHGQKEKYKENPSIDVKIYDRVLAIEAEKGKGHRCDNECKKFKHRYRHDFKSGPVMYGLSDGSILIKAR